MMALWRHALLGAGEGSCGPPTGSAGSCACCLDGTRAHGVCGGRVGGAGALPAQRDSGPLRQVLLSPSRDRASQQAVNRITLRVYTSLQSLDPILRPNLPGNSDHLNFREREPR